MLTKEHVNLAPYTTFRVGGPARFFVIASSEEELEQAVEFASEKSLPIFVLGGGSNVLISDEGFDGLVIKNEIRGVDFLGLDPRLRGDDREVEDDQVFCTAGAGQDWDSFVAECVGNGLSGLELLSGIPGTVGAAPVQNIGAYGASVESVITEVRAYDLQTKSFTLFPLAQCRFSYRSSLFKEESGRYIITSVAVRLSRAHPAIPSYPDFIPLFGQTSAPSVGEIRSAVIEIRSSKGMVILPGHQSYKSAGSFFKNPVIQKNEFEKLPSVSCRSPWYWELSDGRVKVSAACLIQQAGFERGYREGEVGLSVLHTLAIVNYGAATAKDIYGLSKKIQDSVSRDFNVSLEPEVQFVGF